MAQKKRTTKSRLYKKGVFVVPVDIYKHDIGVSVDLTADELLKTIDDKELKKELDSKRDFINSVKDGRRLGGAMYVEESGHTFIVLPPPSDEWEFWEMLMHEVHHIVFWMAEIKMIHNEMEAQAYLHEHIFRTIRRVLMGVEKPT